MRQQEFGGERVFVCEEERETGIKIKRKMERVSRFSY